MTHVEKIIQAVKAALVAGVDDVSVHRGKTSSFDDDQLPVVNLMPDEDESQHLAKALWRNELRMDIEIHVIGESIDEVADPIVAACHTAILQAGGLQELVADVQYRGRVWEREEGSEGRGKVTVNYAFIYSIPAGAI